MSIYNWLEEKDIMNNKTFYKYKWHNFLRQGDVKDLAENWPDIYVMQYSGPLDAKSIYTWIGEQKDKMQKTHYIDVEGWALDEWDLTN